ncbi:MAG: PQQ-like beta-propeller repeat protein [Acidobacteria bacterium]|nr:PQQ-like beta-propeller repeat protein [Acidobacteriota bacterium]
MTTGNSRKRRRSVRALLVLGLLAVAAAPLVADDWAQWRGPDRLAVWQEDGIIERFPEGGLKVKWRTPLRSGFAGPAVAGGRVFVLDWLEDPQSRTLDGTERLVALDEESGEVLWTHEWTTTYRMLMASYAVGPRATPTVDGDRVYAVGATGRLFCFDAASGDVLWSKDYIAEYDTSVPTWGIASAPLVDGDKLIAVVGGEPDALVVAFDKRTGEELWRSVEVVGEMGYGQPVIYEAGGARQLIVWHAAALVSLDPETGEVYWEETWEVGAGMSVATPVRSGDYLLVSQFYNGSLMMRLNADRPAATRLWNGSSRSEMPDLTDGLHSLITTPLIIDDHVYGVGSYGELRGLDARTGERVWMSAEMTTQERWGTAFLVRHRDRYFVNNDAGDLIIAQFTPQGYVELDRTKLIDADGSAGIGAGPNRRWDRAINWTHPAYANRHIVQRNNSGILRASLAASDY